jgi:hypothetical protein
MMATDWISSPGMINQTVICPDDDRYQADENHGGIPPEWYCRPKMAERFPVGDPSPPYRRSDRMRRAWCGPNFPLIPIIF